MTENVLTWLLLFLQTGEEDGVTDTQMEACMKAEAFLEIRARKFKN